MDGRVVVVTGAGGGIGRAHALAFAREGARVLVNDVGGARDGSGAGEGEASSPSARVVAEIVAAGGEAVANGDTVATSAGASAIVAAAVSAFGRVDVLVNNAGILRDKTLLKLDEDAFDQVIAVHLRGTFLCSQAFARQVVLQDRAAGEHEGGEARRGGRIVNTTSVSGMVGNFGQANYSAAKAGIYGLTRTASIELQRYGITVNALAPIAKTRMTDDLPMFQGMESMTPEHVAPAAVFLGSDRCGDRSGYVLAVAGSRMYSFKVVESAGRFKDDDAGVWTADEIAEHWDAIVNVKS